MIFDELCAAAQQGDCDAQFELGSFWWERKNYERAVDIVTKKFKVLCVKKIDYGKEHFTEI